MLQVHFVLQLAVTGSKTAVPVGVGPAWIVFGSVIVMLIRLHGEKFGRSGGGEGCEARDFPRRKCVLGFESAAPSDYEANAEE